MICAIAQATTQPATDFAAGINSIVTSIVAVISGLVLLATSVGALLAAVHVNGKFGAAAALAKTESQHAAAFLAHLSTQVNNHGAQIVSLASTGVGKTIGATLQSTTPLQTLESLAGTLVEPTQNPLEPQASFPKSP